MVNEHELQLELRDTEWPYTYTKQKRQIARAIVVDDEGYYYFAHIERNDIFGELTQIETSGGGIEKGEDPETGVRREVLEELGAKVEILCKLGVVSDYYNLVHRHNINHYFLCRVKRFGEKHLTKDEVEKFHLKTVRLRYEEAVAMYEACRSSKLGRLVAARELPILKRAGELLGDCPAPTVRE